ncbi:MAG: HAD family hydrolase [Acidobacteria bacterium]|nr:HAD family hydrolase [Acidobacteriota bacterium]
MKDIRAVIFDFDGTIADGSTAIHECFTRAFTESGLKPPSFEETTALIGHTLHDMIQSMAGDISEETRNKVLALYRAHAHVILPEKTELKAGVRNLLEFLRANDIKIAIATTKKTGSTEKTLEKMGILNLFSYVAGVDQVNNPKPHPEQLNLVMSKLDSDSENTLMVGDTELDIIAAKKAGTKSVAVLDGFGNREILLASGSDYVIDKVGDLIDLFRSEFDF